MIQMRSVYIGLLSPYSLDVCGDPERVYNHLCDHLLTRPESLFWAKLIPSRYPPGVNPDDGADLLRYARRLWVDGFWARKEVPGERELYDGYAAAIQSGLEQCVALKWYWRKREYEGETVWLGLTACGLYIVWTTKQVRTAMLLAVAAQKEPRKPTKEERRDNPLPRQRPWKDRAAAEPGPSLAEAAGPDGQAGRAESTCYFLFRRGLSKFRREYRNACLEQGARVVSHPTELLATQEWDRWVALPCSLKRPECNCAGSPAV